ncbi:hypothetical protein [Paenibacillus sp. TY11]
MATFEFLKGIDTSFVDEIEAAGGTFCEDWVQDDMLRLKRSA